MAKISPFACFRPARALAQRFVQKPTDFPPEERDNIEKLLNKSVYSISQPDLFGKTFEDGKQKFSQLFKNGFIFPEINKAFYIYEITDADGIRTGLVTTQHMSDYRDEVIKTHENTRQATRNYLLERYTKLRLNFTPIFSFYDAFESINEQLLAWKGNLAADLEFATNDGKQHAVWKIDEQEKIDWLVERFDAIDQIYLADGHHRLNMLKVVYDNLHIAEEKRWIPNIIFPAKAMKLYSFARLLRDSNAEALRKFERILETKFEEIPVTEKAAKQAYDVYYNNTWRRYRLNTELLNTYEQTGIGYLEALNKEVFELCFDITDQRNDERILFFKDFMQKSELELSVKKTHSDLAIQLHPIDVKDIIRAADEGLELPPKSSLFEPKPRAGLFITQI